MKRILNPLLTYALVVSAVATSIAGLPILRSTLVSLCQQPHSLDTAQARHIEPQKTIPVHFEGTAPLTLPDSGPPPPGLIQPREAMFNRQLQQIEEYFLRQIASTPATRDRVWRPDFSSVAAYSHSVLGHQRNLRDLLGLSEMTGGKPQINVLEENPDLRIEDVVLPLDVDFQAQGLLFLPRARQAKAAIVAIPSASESREQFAGLGEGMAPARWLTTLLSRNVAVCIPLTVERLKDHPLCLRTGLDRRHLLYRLGFIVGRTMVGIEVQQVLALRCFLALRTDIDPDRIGIMGERQGGMTALYAAAADQGFKAVTVLDYFQQREACWKEPVDRALYGQLKEFGDAELATLIAPRPLTIVHTPDGPTPARSVNAEVTRALRFYKGLGQPYKLAVLEEQSDDPLSTCALRTSEALGMVRTVAGKTPSIAIRLAKAQIENSRNEHFEALHRYLCRLDMESDRIREDHWKLFSTSRLERENRVKQLHKELSQLVGVVPREDIPLNTRTALIKVTGKFVAFDVLLDVLRGVEAYGQLLVPRNRRGRLPAIICQHGLGGRPADVTGIGAHPDPTYHAFAARLAERGYVVFAPYIAVPIRQEMLVNPLVRQAAALGEMRTSIELAKLHRIVDFLQSLPFVDAERIGYYGLSYGGYSGIWMSALEPRLKAIVVSGFFNDWQTKLTDEENPTSYLLHPDEDFYNWNVLRRFTHLELIAAMWPRPACIESASRDGTTTPQWHSRTWAQVKRYVSAWNLADRIVDDYFDGVHEIHGTGTFTFVDRWLRPERSASRDYGYSLRPTSRELPGLSDNSAEALPYVTYRVDSSKASLVRGTFFTSNKSSVFSGLALRASRVGRPGDLLVRLGTREGAADIGVVRIPARTVYPLFDLWYEAEVKPVRLDASKLYFLEITAESGETQDDYYLLYGPKPLGGADISPNFGLAFRVLTTGEPRVGSQREASLEFIRSLLAPYKGGPPLVAGRADPRKAGEVAVTSGWLIYVDMGADEVVQTAAADFSQFFQNIWHINVGTSSGAAKRYISLRTAPPGLEGVVTGEGYRVEVTDSGISVSGLTSRGVMRGVYELEDQMRLRGAPFLKKGVVVRNCRFARRITCAVHPDGGIGYTETSWPLIYTDGLLQRISHDGFNGIWVWLNTEEATLDSKIFPELNDPYAATRLARLDSLSRRARRYGLDVYLYLSTGYHHHLPNSFFERHPAARGYGWGPPLCSSNEEVRQYYAETVQTIFQRAPVIKGLVVIYDSEGFWYCGNSEKSHQECPRCRHFTQEALASQLLTTLDDAMHEVGGPNKVLIAFNYGNGLPWILKLIPLLPKDIIFQADFDKGMIADKDGIRHKTEDYNISNLGPPDYFLLQYEAARAQGLIVLAKTEHAVSTEFIFVPYIPCMEQWYERVARMRQFDLGGWFGNWDHYGYTPSRPAELINQMSFDPVPSMEKLLGRLAERDFGSQATPYILRAWHDFSEGIREYPYSDPVARTPGPIQKGPSIPLFPDFSVKGFGAWRSWQNDLTWTRPWGPEIARKYLKRVAKWYGQGIAEIETAHRIAPEAYRPAIWSELGVARTIQSSVQSALNLIDWITARDQFVNATSESKRKEAAAWMTQVALEERDNAEGALPFLQADSRLGYASEGGGVVRGGLFTPELVSWKIGELDDLLLCQLPALTGQPPSDALVDKILPNLALSKVRELRRLSR